MSVPLAVRSTGDGRRPSRYVFLDYGAFSPDLTRCIKLPPTLYKLWVVLTDRPNQVVSYLDLTQAYWPDTGVSDPETTLVHVGRLKRLLAQIDWPPGTLEVVWGRGVMFRLPRA